MKHLLVRLFAIFFIFSILFIFNKAYAYSDTVSYYTDTQENTLTTYTEYREERERLVYAITNIYGANIDNVKARKLVEYTYLYAMRENINPRLLLGLIAAESSFRGSVKSKDGAIGYTQVLAKWHKDKIGNRDIRELKTNIEIGVMILKNCFSSYRKVNTALACYNGNVKRPKAAYRYTSKVHARGSELIRVAGL